jgi:hypothetical protein
VTLLLENTNRDTHFAGLLVNSLTLGGQQVPNSLYALAMKVRGDDQLCRVGLNMIP